MTDKPKLPEHIKKFYDLSTKVDRAIATTDHHHRKAYLAGEEKIMTKEGQVDHDLLKEAEFQDKFVDAMSGTYIEAARKYFKIGKDAKGDEIWNEQLINAYAGTTRGQLTQAVREAKDRFTYNTFKENYQDKLMEQLEGQLRPITHAHLTDEHIDDILKHTGTDSLIDKGKINRMNAIGLLSHYRKEKAIGKSALRAYVPDYALKKEEYRSDYVKKKDEEKKAA